MIISAETIIKRVCVLAVILGIAMAFIINKAEAADNMDIIGDINRDSEINATDSLLCLRHSVKEIELTEDEIRQGDVNADGQINAEDSLLILKKSVSTIEKFAALPYTTISSVSDNGDLSATITWVTVKNITGYNIQISEKDTFDTIIRTDTVSSNETTLNIRNLSDEKTYYFRVRTYATAESGEQYSAWSAVKSIKMSFEVPTIRYRAHVEDQDWMDWVSDGITAGTTGQGLRMEALQVDLSQNGSSMLQYRVHAADIGWIG